jgi:hypothetical protein
MGSTRIAFQSQSSLEIVVLDFRVVEGCGESGLPFAPMLT